MRGLLGPITLLLFLQLFPRAGSAQDAATAPAGLLLSLGYGPFLSAADLGDRFGNGFSLEGSAAYQLKDRRIGFGLVGQFGFGNTVKEDVLQGIRTDAGYIIGNQRSPAGIELRQRQFFLGALVSYRLLAAGPAGSGVYGSTSLGYFSSRIRFQEDPVQFVPQIERAKQAGYDRLSGGPAVVQFFGYRRFPQQSGLSYYLGAEVLGARTRSLRSYDLTGLAESDARRSDVVFGFRLGLILPITGGDGKEIYY